MVSKEGNTKPLLISSKQKYGNMVSFLLPLESIYQNPGLPGMMGNILVKKFSWVEFFRQHGVLLLSLIYIRSWQLGRRECIQSYPFDDWCISPRKEKSSKPQQEKTKRNPSEESLGISNHKEDPSWRQKEVIPRCQRENFCQ